MTAAGTINFFSGAHHMMKVAWPVCLFVCLFIYLSVCLRYRMRKHHCPSCNYSWCENIKDSDMKLRKVRARRPSASMFPRLTRQNRTVFSLQVDFIWINRDQKAFEWFVSLLTKLELDQADEEPEGGPASSVTLTKTDESRVLKQTLNKGPVFSSTT